VATKFTTNCGDRAPGPQLVAESALSNTKHPQNVEWHSPKTPQSSIGWDTANSRLQVDSGH